MPAVEEKIESIATKQVYVFLQSEKVIRNIFERKDVENISFRDLKAKIPERI